MEHVDQAIRVLNDALRADHNAMLALVNHRIHVSEKLAKHPTIQVGQDSSLGIVGLINGLFGVDDNNWGHIVMDCDTAEAEPGRVPRIMHIDRFRRR